MPDAHKSIRFRAARSPTSGGKNGAHNPELTRDPDAPIVESQLADLGDLRGAGMNLVRRMDRRVAGKLPEEEAKAFGKIADPILSFARLSRSVRQIIVLEQELMGLRMPQLGRDATYAERDDKSRLRGFRKWPGKDPDDDCYENPDTRDASDLYDHDSDLRDTDDLADPEDSNDTNDYLAAPADEIIARVRTALGVPQPADTPIAPEAALRAYAATGETPNFTPRKLTARANAARTQSARTRGPP